MMYVAMCYMRKSKEDKTKVFMLSEHMNINEAICSMHMHAARFSKIFIKNGFNPRNNNFRLASGYKDGSFVEINVMDLSTYNMISSALLNITPVRVPRDFGSTTGRMTKTELSMFYGVKPDVISAQEKCSKHTAIVDMKRPTGTSGRKRMEIPKDLAYTWERIGSTRDLAKHYGVAHMTVIGWLNEKDLMVNQRRSLMTIPADFSDNAKYMSRADLAAVYSVSTATIDRWRYELDAYAEDSCFEMPQTRGRKKRLVPDDLEEVANNALTKKEIAEHYSVSVTTVAKWLKEKGIVVRTKDNRYKKIPRDIDKYIHLTAADLAEIYNVSVPTAYRWRRESRNALGV